LLHRVHAPDGEPRTLDSNYRPAEGGPARQRDHSDRAEPGDQSGRLEATTPGGIMPDKEQPLSNADIAARLTSMPAWSFEHGAIRRTYKTDGWRGSMLVTNAIAFICEAADHH